MTSREAGPLKGGVELVDSVLKHAIDRDDLLADAVAKLEAFDPHGHQQLLDSLGLSERSVDPQFWSKNKDTLLQMLQRARSNEPGSYKSIKQFMSDMEKLIASETGNQGDLGRVVQRMASMVQSKDTMDISSAFRDIIMTRSLLSASGLGGLGSAVTMMPMIDLWLKQRKNSRLTTKMPPEDLVVMASVVDDLEKTFKANKAKLQQIIASTGLVRAANNFTKPLGQIAWQHTLRNDPAARDKLTFIRDALQDPDNNQGVPEGFDPNRIEKALTNGNYRGISPTEVLFTRKLEQLSIALQQNDEQTAESLLDELDRPLQGLPETERKSILQRWVTRMNEIQTQTQGTLEEAGVPLERPPVE